MKVLVILGHPGKASFNHAIADTAVRVLKANGHQVMFHDLYEEGFDPVLPFAEIKKEANLDKAVQQHCDEIASADGIIIVHPNWWGQPPALVKGWIDRVIRPGVAYEFAGEDGGEGVPIGLLKAQSALVFNTSNTPQQRESEVFGDPLETIWKNCIFDLCGVKDVYRKMFGVIVTSSEEQRKSWLNDVRETVSTYYPADGVR